MPFTSCLVSLDISFEWILQMAHSNIWFKLTLQTFKQNQKRENTISMIILWRTIVWIAYKDLSLTWTFENLSNIWLAR